MRVLKHKIEDAAEKNNRRSVLLVLNKDDYNKLRALVSASDTNNSEVLRQCLRHVYDLETQNQE